MNITYDIDVERRLITFDVRGDFTLSAMSEAYEAMFGDPAYDPDFNTISFFDKTDRLDIDYKDIGYFRALVKKLDSRRGWVALVTGPDTGRYLYFKLAAVNFNIIKSNPYQAFKARAEALEWLAAG